MEKDGKEELKTHETKTMRFNITFQLNVNYFSPVSALFHEKAKTCFL